MDKLLREYVRLMLIEYQGSGQASNFPFNYGRAPGLGFGTGMGGNSHSIPHRGSLGGNKMQPNPTKPYSTEFADDNEQKRSDEWDASLRKFEQGIDDLKRDLSMAGSKRDVEDILGDLVKGAYDVSEDIVADHGTYDSLLRKGNVQKAKMMLSQGIDRWVKEIVAQRKAIDDVTGLADMTYERGSWQEQGKGSRSWS